MTAPQTNQRNQPSMAALLAVWSSDAYAARVRQLENEGLTTSDAQSVADAELTGNQGDTTND